METKSYRDSLKKEAIKHEEDLEKEISSLISNAKNSVRNFLVIGGSLAIAYWIVKKITKSTPNKVIKSKNDSENHDNINAQPPWYHSISDIILKELSLFLLEYAKGKILEYLANITNENDHS